MLFCRTHHNVHIPFHFSSVVRPTDMNQVDHPVGLSKVCSHICFMNIGCFTFSLSFSNAEQCRTIDMVARGHPGGHRGRAQHLVWLRTAWRRGQGRWELATMMMIVVVGLMMIVVNNKKSQTSEFHGVAQNICSRNTWFFFYLLPDLWRSGKSLETINILMCFQPEIRLHAKYI